MAAESRRNQNTKHILGTNSQQLLIISIKEARKLLGKDGKQLTDDQIKNLIITLTELSSILLNQKGSIKSAG